MSIKRVHTHAAPRAIGPYSQAVISTKTGLIFAAGQIPVDPQTGEIAGPDIETQAKQVLTNLQAVLAAAGSGLESVIKTTVFLKDMNDFAAMNAVYAGFFEKNPPARSAVEAARLPKDVLIEIECVAEVSG